MNRVTVKTLTSTSLFVSLGVLVPVAFHALGLGKVFLPMHIPVLLAGMLMGPATGLFTGALSPLLSAFLTGMPTFAPPVAQMMVCELSIYGLVSGILATRTRLQAPVCLIASMLAGRVLYGLMAGLLLPVFGLAGIPMLYPLTAGLASSLPGIALQLVTVPALVTLVKRARGRATQSAPTDRP